MPQAKRGPKAKPKDVKPVVVINEPYNVEFQESPFIEDNTRKLWNSFQPVGNLMDRTSRVWDLASEIILTKVQSGGKVTNDGILEILEWAKLLDRELYG